VIGFRSQVRSGLYRLLTNPDSRLFKRSSCEAREKSTSGGVFTDTLERGDRAQRKQVGFFNSLFTLESESLSDLPNSNNFILLRPGENHKPR
jgi:hypothetical protein